MRDVAQALAQGLAAAGVRRMFGMPGGGPNLDMIGAAGEVGIPFVLAHGETAACIMAASYGRLTGTPGVAVVTRGPGLTSAVNGLAQATLDRFPLLLISDAVSAAHADRVAHQRLDQVAVAHPVTKWSGTLGTSRPDALGEAAARLALAAPSGAVHLAFDPTLDGDVPPEIPSAVEADLPTWEEARRLLMGARRPVVIVGVDAVPNANDVRAAIEHLGCPIMATYEAKGVVPESWQTYAGLFTGATIERPLLEQADLVLGIGLDTVEQMPGPWPYEAAVVLLHGHAAETRYFGEPVQVVGPYADHLPRLLDGVRPDWPPDVGAGARRAADERLQVAADGLSPLDVVRVTQQVLDRPLLTVDAGAHMLVAMPLWQSDEAGSVLISNGLATMGFALPAAVATALARPGRRVVCFTGDGGLGMVLAELETLARLQLDVTVVVFNDAALTLIELKQRERQGGQGAVRYQPVDFSGVATAMGLRGTAVEDVEGLRRALEAVHAGPCLIDARVDPSVYPHVIRAVRG